MLAKPISKKEPVTYNMIVNICEKYASLNANLSELRVAALCVTAVYAFLRFNEIAALRCCDLKFCSKDGIQFVELYIVKSKTDIYRNGSKVLLAYTGGLVCPFSILKRYVETADILLSSPEKLFSKVYYVAALKCYKLRPGGLSYSRAREIVLQAFESLGYDKKKFGLHSLRSGGATAAANAGLNERLLKRHGRWKTDLAKDGYVQDDLDAMLSVSRCLQNSNV